MPLVHVALVVITLAFQDAQPRADCQEWQECRQFALEAAEQQDYERFHDLAWRAVQKGPKNDPAIMYLLARAQSLSGRPGDALVMLQRLAQMGTKTDAATNDDFRRVRALPGWAAEIDAESWAQVLLKYLVSHPAVTVAIPGTIEARHIVDNQGAGRGRLPDAAMRREIERYWDAL